MITLIVLSCPCLIIGMYVYTLKQLDKENNNITLNKVQSFCLKYLLPVFAFVGVVGILCGFIGLFELTFGLTLTTIALRF